MGTLAIFRSLWKYWEMPNFPLFLYQEGRHTLIETEWIAALNALIRRFVMPFIALIVGAVAFVGFLSLCGFSSFFTTIPMFSLCVGIVFGIGAFAIILLIYLWPVPVAVAASGTIADDREHQTWELVLATPIERSDVLLSKLAYSQRGLTGYGELLFWVQGLLIVLIFIIIVAKLGGTYRMTWLDGILTLFLIILSMIEFGIGRIQDYVLAGLLGVTASLISGSRQAALFSAFMGALGMVLLRGVITGVFVMAIGSNTVQAAQVIFFATGPSSLVVLALPHLIALLVLIAMPLGRELTIRWLFGWLVAHMGDTSASAVF
jgi:hypothetical protein